MRMFLLFLLIIKLKMSPGAIIIGKTVLSVGLTYLHRLVYEMYRSVVQKLKWVTQFTEITSSLI